jgi:hypothetical protein
VTQTDPHRPWLQRCTPAGLLAIHRLLPLVGAVCLGTLTTLGEAPPAPSADPTNPPPSIRFVADGPHAGRVETVVRTYRNPQDIQVTLFGAVHVGDGPYYRDLQKRFTTCDALLYEMIRDSDNTPSDLEVDTSHPVSQLQLGMKNLLNLEFQLEAIDYTPANFVHADLDPTTFHRLQRERSESLLGLMFRVMLEEQARLNTGQGSTVSSMSLLLALMNPDRGYALKLVLGRQMEQLEALVAGIDQDPDGQGSVIVGARNEHAIQVLEQQITQGRRQLGIFYGAAHLPDFHQRLLQRGFKPDHEEWLTAWDIRPRSPQTPPTP